MRSSESLTRMERPLARRGSSFPAHIDKTIAVPAHGLLNRILSVSAVPLDPHGPPRMGQHFSLEGAPGTGRLVNARVFEHRLETSDVTD